ncbi:hypothetical protein GALMADRAFT_255822 [Galerina marginata CBS 339.88]|uniref:Uncharacterized protein n=1 Tax=Galerina marginata (strain CBS 339.88) TaxID=685588 RepID=A0A067SPK4_GALM3|nr:hypothetical protein GALMADRAFT_255822 [Galerina marginata CBS 339.88]
MDPPKRRDVLGGENSGIEPGSSDRRKAAGEEDQRRKSRLQNFGRFGKGETTKPKVRT